MDLGELKPGSVFARDYQIVRPLSSGGMGAVYVAKQLSTSKERALKLMRRELVSSPEQRRRFEQEARVGAEIDSDHVVEVVGAGVDEATGLPWLAMELLQGQDLAEVSRRKGPLGPAAVAMIFEQLCHALGRAHEKRIVHRDLKPENVFLSVSKRAGVAFTVKVLDFGIAKTLAEAQTKMTAAIGTPLWMAPEQTEAGQSVSPATDVWALGLIAFQLLVGRPYWKSAADADASTMMILREVLMGPMPSASERARSLGGPTLPAGFDAWFATCVAREAHARIPNAATAHAALARILGAAAASGGLGDDDEELVVIDASHERASTLAARPLTAQPLTAQPERSSARGETEIASQPAELTSVRTTNPTEVAPRPQPTAPANASLRSAGEASKAPARTPGWAWAALGLGLVALGGGAFNFMQSRAEPTERAHNGEPLLAPSSAPHPYTNLLAASVNAPNAYPVVELPAPTNASSEVPSPQPQKAPAASEPVKAPPASSDRPFDRGAAAAAMSSAAGRARGCKTPGGPTGSSNVQVTFSPDGRATSTTVAGPLAGTPTGACIASAFRSATVPPFAGAPVKVTKSVTID